MGTTPLLKSADHSRDFASVFDCLINVCAFDQAINSKMLGAQSNIFSRCLLSACWRSEWILNRHTELNRHIELIRAWWVLVCWLKVRLAEAVWDPLKAVVAILSYRKDEMVAMLHWQIQQNSSSSVHSYHSLRMGLELRDGFLQWTPGLEVWSVTCTTSAHVTLPEPAGSAELHDRQARALDWGTAVLRLHLHLLGGGLYATVCTSAYTQTCKKDQDLQSFQVVFFFIFEYYT